MLLPPSPFVCYPESTTEKSNGGNVLKGKGKTATWIIQERGLIPEEIKCEDQPALGASDWLGECGASQCIIKNPQHGIRLLGADRLQQDGGDADLRAVGPDLR